MKKILIFILFATLTQCPIAQNARIDSLKRVIETTRVDTVKGHALCRLCDEFRKVGDYQAALKQGQDGLSLCKAKADAKGEAGCLKSIGNIYSYQGDYLKALEYHQKSLKIREKLGNQADIAGCLNNLGNIYTMQSDYPKALEYQQKSLKIREKIGNPADIAASLINIGNIYNHQSDYPKALDYHQKSLKIQEKIGNQAGIAYCLNNIGIIYNYQSDYPKALEYQQKSLKILEKIGNQVGIAASLLGIGNIYYYQSDYPKALDYYQKSLKIQEKIGNQVGIAASLNSIGSLHFGQKEYAIARAFTEKGLRLAQEIGHLEYKNDGARTLYKIESAVGNWNAAFNALYLLKTYSDSLKNDEKSQEMGRVESKAEFDKQAELEKQKNEEEKRITAKQNQWIVFSILGGLVFVMIIAFTLFRGRRKEKRANTALRELNEEIKGQKSEIEAQNTEINAINAELQATLEEVNNQNIMLEEQHEKIEDSIRYASRIQSAIMPSEEQLVEHLPPHFIHYQPRDIVSGDFYWMTQQGDSTYFAVVDCTGHGVPGAFMSVLGSNLLHQIVDENQITDADVILSELDRRVSETLRQSFGGDSNDGMDLALIVLHAANEDGSRVIEFAGAGRPLWHFSAGEIIEYKSAKYSCGGSQHEAKAYPASRIQAAAGDRIFIFSDGPVDQFGGPKGRKLGSKQLQSFLQETTTQSIVAQGQAFNLFFNGWMKNKTQLDDVLLVGISL